MDLERRLSAAQNKSLVPSRGALEEQHTLLSTVPPLQIPEGMLSSIYGNLKDIFNIPNSIMRLMSVLKYIFLSAFGHRSIKHT